jgi:flagellar motor switch protein FliM
MSRHKYKKMWRAVMVDLNDGEVEFLLDRGVAKRAWIKRVPRYLEKALNDIYEDYAERVAKRLSKYFKTAIEAKFISLDELTFSEVWMSIGNAGRVYTFGLPPLDGVGILDVNNDLFRYLLKLKAGRDTAKEEGDENPRLSKGELKFFRKIASFILKELCIAHKTTEKHGFKLCEPMCGMNRLDRLALAWDQAILLTFELKRGDFQSVYGICLPYKMLSRCFLTKVPVPDSYINFYVEDGRIEESCLSCILVKEFLEKHRSKDEEGAAE